MAGVSRVVTNSLSPQGRAYTRALKSEGSLSPPIPVGGGAVDTNDGCIRPIYLTHICLLDSLDLDQAIMLSSLIRVQTFSLERFALWFHKGLL